MNDLSNKLLLVLSASIPALVVTLGFIAMNNSEVTILNLSIGVLVWFFLSALFLYKWRKEDDKNIQTEQPKEYVPDSPVKELFDLLVLKGDILVNYQFKYNGNIYSINSNTSGWWCSNSDKHELKWLTDRESNWLFCQISKHTKQKKVQVKAEQREQVGRDIQEQLTNIPLQNYIEYNKQEKDMNNTYIPKQGDYVSVKDMKEYADSKGKTLQQIYALVYDKFIQAGSEEGEGLKHAGYFTLDDETYGWSKTSYGMFFCSEGEVDMSEHLTNKISVAALLEQDIAKILDWNNMPPVGTKVRFIRYDNGHDHWGYEVGKVYTIGENNGRVGPLNGDGEALLENWDNSFVFEILQEENMNNNFSKKDLKDGMMLTLRSGDIRYVLLGSTWGVSGNTSTKGADLTDYCEDLLICVYPLGERNGDIVKVTDRDGTVVYVRQEERATPEVELTLEQVAEKFGLDVGQIRIKK